MKVRSILLIAVGLLAGVVLVAADVPFNIDDLEKDAMATAQAVGASQDIGDGAAMDTHGHSDEILNLLGSGSRRNMRGHMEAHARAGSPSMIEKAANSKEERDSMELGSVPMRTAFNDMQPKILGDVAFSFYSKIRDDGYLTPGERQQVRSLIEEEANIQLNDPVATPGQEEEEAQQSPHRMTAEEKSHAIAEAVKADKSDPRERPLRDISFVELEAPSRRAPHKTEDVIRQVDSLTDPTLQDIVEAQSEHPNFLEVDATLTDPRNIDYEQVSDYDLANSDMTASPEFMELGTEVFDAIGTRRGFIKSIGRGIKKVAKKVWSGVKKVAKKVWNGAKKALFGGNNNNNNQQTQPNVSNQFKIQLVKKKATPRQIEDCSGCRMVWEQVEMDVGSPRYVEDVQASFEHNCMDAQKSTIFYGVCEDMYDDMYAMTDDYMAGKYPVVAMCMRAKICAM